MIGLFDKATFYLRVMAFTGLLFCNFLFAGEKVQITNQTDRTYKIGVLAYKGKEAAIKSWKAHEIYLNQQLAPLKFKIIPLGYKGNELTQAVINRQLDFVITNPGHYIELELGGHISRLATRRMSSSEGVLDQFGGVAFSKAEKHAINYYSDLAGKTILIPSTSSLGGWQVHLREAVAAGVDLRVDSQIVELKSHRKVVLAILAGDADVGFVRSDLIEGLVDEGLLRFEQIKIIDKKISADYPYLLSTRLYPEWPIAVVTGTSVDVSVQVLQALLELSVNDAAAKAAKIYGWTIFGNYSTVADLFRETRLGPYKPQPISLRVTLYRYAYEIIGILVFFVFMFLSVLRTAHANNYLKKEVIERKKIEQALRKSEYDFRQLFEEAEISIWNEDMSAVYDSLQQLREKGITDLQGYLQTHPGFVKETLNKVKVVHVNKATLKLFNVKAEQELLSNIGNSFGDKALAVFREEVNAIWNGKASFKSEINFQSFTGQSIDAIISFSIPETREGFSLIPVCILDITTAKQAEIELIKSERGLALAQQISHLGSWELDHTTQKLSWSDVVYHIFEIDHEQFDASYQTIVDCIHPEDREWVNQAFIQSVKNRTQYDIEYRLLMQDERVKYVNERCETTYDEQGGSLKSMGTMLDVTERTLIHDELEKRVMELSLARKAALNMMQDVESARQTAEHASRAKSEFLANMSHEIRTPLNAVTGMSYLLKQTQLTEKQAEYIETIHCSMSHVTSIINDLLDFSKIEAGKLELESVSFDLDKVLDSVTDFVMQQAESKGIELLYDMPLEIPRSLIGDPTRLTQVLINLVGNAIKFCDQGEVIVRIVIEKIQAETAILAIGITDTGIGMDATQVGSLFEAFKQADSSTTRRYGGTGLGLAISKYLVEAMHGELNVKSTIGVGSEFSFTVQLGLQAQDKYKSFTIPADLRKLNVLVVDDNYTSREVLGAILEELSFHCVKVNSGMEAINLLEQPNNEQKFDLILLDWMMPEMNGIETATLITHKLKLPNSPLIILVSAFEKERVMVQASDAGIHSYLHKPVNASILYDCIMQTMGKQLPKAHWRKAINEQTKTTRINGEGRRILVVEDQPVNRQIATEILIRNGFVVESVENGKLAVELIKKDASVFDAILMDIQMPVMDGHEATRLIRQIADKDQLPIIAMTAHALEEERQKCRVVGMNAHISKPVDVALMLAELSKCLGISTLIDSQVMDEFATHLPDQVPGIELKEGLQRVMGNQKLYCKLLTEFPTQYQTVLTSLWQAIENQQYDAAAKLAHMLAGSAGNLSMVPLRLACKSLQQLLIKGNSDAEMLTLVERRFAQVVESIEALALTADEIIESDPPELSEEEVDSVLQELAGLLENNDLRAGGEFERLRNMDSDKIDSEALKVIGEYIARLDYAKALGVLKEF